LCRNFHSRQAVLATAFASAVSSGLVFQNATSGLICPLRSCVCLFRQFLPCTKLTQFLQEFLM
jgi:hypothetical protein